ncbi:hypothetical protein BG006_004528 [Podila minutissima]|uniref:Uncharacterized protein n=1 Tax=Podila minutissima TaxID=64525 RepID=A0A9P5VMN2_9FUNG|nr:hypothetical protein BG006_004528 [Podila minutissima]
MKSLHNFLFVNRFFFHAALPMFMHDVFITWHLNLRDGRDRNDKEILMALLLPLSSTATRDRLLTLFDPQDILNKFGLELVWPATMDLVSDASSQAPKAKNMKTRSPSSSDQNTGMRSRCLPELQHIRPHYVGTAPGAVKILNDATTAFAPSLRTVTVECGRYGWRSIPPTYAVGQALDHWNLPWMTHLKIDIPKLPILCFGADNPPQELEDDNRTLELFPKWTLPRLMELDLDYTPALLFNYDSWETMSNLRQIYIYAQEDSELMQHVHRIPRLTAHVTPLQDPESVGCPRLKHLNLYCSDHPQRLPLSWSAPCALTLLPMTEPAEIPWVDAYSPTQPQLYQPLGPFSGDVKDPPLLDHQLAGLKMYGRWVMSEKDFVRVLTHNAPNLQDLDVGLIHEFNDANRKGY